MARVPSNATGLVTCPAVLGDLLYLLADPVAGDAPASAETGTTDTNARRPHGSKVSAVAVCLAAGFVLVRDELATNPADIVEQRGALGGLADAVPVGLLGGTRGAGRRC
jgi:hypothetical protein